MAINHYGYENDSNWQIISRVNMIGKSSTTFSDIPQSFSELALIVRGVYKVGKTGTIVLRVNGATSNYSYIRTYTDPNSDTVHLFSTVAGSSLTVTAMPGSETSGTAIARLPRYADSTQTKNINIEYADTKSLSNTVGGWVGASSPITSVTVAVLNLDGTLDSGEVILYGIK